MAKTDTLRVNEAGKSGAPIAFRESRKAARHGIRSTGTRLLPAFTLRRYSALRPPLRIRRHGGSLDATHVSDLVNHLRVLPDNRFALRHGSFQLRIARLVLLIEER
jgi:hypothetical protein